jgi:hypothetical protein
LIATSFTPFKIHQSKRIPTISKVWAPGTWDNNCQKPAVLDFIEQQGGDSDFWDQRTKKECVKEAIRLQKKWAEDNNAKKKTKKSVKKQSVKKPVFTFGKRKNIQIVNEDEDSGSKSQETDDMSSSVSVEAAGMVSSKDETLSAKRNTKATKCAARIFATKKPAAPSGKAPASSESEDSETEDIL